MTTVIADSMPPAFYRLSGRTPVPALLLALVAAPLIGFVVGSLIGPLEVFGHMLGYLKLMLLAEGCTVFGGGAILGFLMAKLLMRWKCRSILLLDLSVSLAGVVTLYFAWAAWLYTFVHWTHGNSSYSRLVIPGHLFHAITVINDIGTWYISTTDKPTGLALTLIWLLEAGTLLLTATMFAHKQLAKHVFCEACSTWGQKRHLMQIHDATIDNMKSGLLAGRTDVFDNVARPNVGALTWCDVTLEGCPTCDNLQALTLERTVMTPAKNGKFNTKTTRVVKRLLLTPDQTAQVAMIAASLQRPAVPAPTSPEFPT